MASRATVSGTGDATTARKIDTKDFSNLATLMVALAIALVMLVGCDDNVIAPGPTVNNSLFSSVTQVAPTGTFGDPTSTVPDASDQFIYLVAKGTNGAGVFKVASAGGGVTELFVGAPFVHPTDLAFGTDNQTLYITDSSAGGTGRIYSLSIGGGAPVEVLGTAGTAPVALDVIQRGGQDIIYFTGTDASDGQKAIFEIPVSGAASPVLRHKGGMSYPAGIVSAKDGTLFISGGGRVHRLSGTTMSEIANGIRMGSIPGITLTPDDGTVVVSSKSASDGTAQVEIIDLATGNRSIFNKTIGANSNPAGLHAARNAGGATGIYSWADLQSGVYRLRP